MKNRDIKKLFYKYCGPYIYVPSIFDDEIWEYLMSTTGKFMGTSTIWEDFYNIAVNTYMCNTEEMEDEIYHLTMDVVKFLNDKYNEKKLTEDVLNIDNSVGFTSISNGRYLTIDIKNCHIQTMLYFDIIKQNELDEIFGKYKNGEILKTRKWLLRNICNLSGIKLYCKKIFTDAIEQNDPLLSKIKDNYILIGDRLFIPIKEKDIELYKDFLYKNYTMINGVEVFVDICEKTTLRRGLIPEIFIDNSANSSRAFYVNVDNVSYHINYDIYPQIYKKLKKLPLNEYDILYGYDDVYAPFSNTIWDTK